MIAQSWFLADCYWLNRVHVLPPIFSLETAEIIIIPLHLNLIKSKFNIHSSDGLNELKSRLETRNIRFYFIKKLETYKNWTCVDNFGGIFSFHIRKWKRQIKRGILSWALFFCSNIFISVLFLCCPLCKKKIISSKFFSSSVPDSGQEQIFFFQSEIMCSQKIFFRYFFSRRRFGKCWLTLLKK